MKRFLLVALVVFVAQGYAQKDTAAPPVYGWAHSAVVGVNLSQVSFTHWAPGGENALSWTGTAEGKSADDQEKFNWTNSCRFAYGQSRLGDHGLQKTDDKIDLESVLIYKIGPQYNPYVS